MKRFLVTAALASVLASVALPACTAGEGDPSAGKVTLAFPSTQAAVGTDFVQLLVFDITPADRASICLDKITARKRREPLGETAALPPWNVCELNAGRPPVTIGYGEKAILAIGQRKDPGSEQLEDFLIGCVVQTIGDGDAPLPIHLSLIDVGSPVPETNCATVADWCGERCQ